MQKRLPRRSQSWRGNLGVRHWGELSLTRHELGRAFTDSHLARPWCSDNLRLDHCWRCGRRAKDQIAALREQTDQQKGRFHPSGAMPGRARCASRENQTLDGLRSRRHDRGRMQLHFIVESSEFARRSQTFGASRHRSSRPRERAPDSAKARAVSGEVAPGALTASPALLPNIVPPYCSSTR